MFSDPLHLKRCRKMMQVFVLFRISSELFFRVFQFLEGFSGLDGLTCLHPIHILPAFRSRVFWVDFSYVVLDELVCEVNGGVLRGIS